MRLDALGPRGQIPPRSVLNEITCLSSEGVTPVRGDYPDDLPIPGHSDPVKQKAWTTASAKALEILAKKGLRPAKKLGCGTYGCAYTIEGLPNRVLKLTGDNVEAASVQTVLAAIQDGRTTWESLPALSHFYCVYALARTDGTPLGIFALIQNKMRPLSAKEQRFVTTYRYTILSASSRANAVRRAEEQLGPEAAQQVQRLGDTVGELGRIGVWWDDLHAGNVMQDDAGNWKIIDLGAGESQAEVSLTVVEGLRAPSTSRDAADVAYDRVLNEQLSIIEREERLSIIEVDRQTTKPRERLMGSRVQSILFLKDEYTAVEAKRWVQKHAEGLGEILEGVDLRTITAKPDGEDARYWHIRLYEPEDVVEGTFGTKTIKRRGATPVILIRTAVPQWRADLGQERLPPRRRPTR